MNRASGRRAVALAAVVLAGAVSCGLPTPGGVRVDRRVDPGAAYDEPDIRRLPVPPAPGAPPVAIVNGFFSAASGQEADPVVARQFLAPGTAWDSSAGALVYTPDPSGTSVTLSPDRRTVAVSLHQTAVIDTSGSYRPQARDVVLRIGVSRVEGAWRVNKVPPGVGLVLSDTDVAHDYRSASVYRLARTVDALVADPVQLPVTQAALPGAIVRALFGPSSSWLAPAVRPTLPPGTHVIDTVTAIGGVVTVDLSREAATLGPRARQLLVAQLVASLIPLPSVDRLRLLVEGRAVLPGDGTVGAEAVDAAGVDSASSPGHSSGASAVVAGGLLRWATPLPAGAIAAPVEAFASLGAVAAPALSADGYVAVLHNTPAGEEVMGAGPGSTPRVWLGPGAWIAPTWAAGMGLLVGSGGQTPSIRVVERSGTSTQALVGTLPGPLDVLVASPDGARVAAITGPAGSRSMYLGRLGSVGGRPQVDGWEPVDLPSGVGDVSAAAWVDGTTLMLVTPAQDASQSSTLWRFPLDGSDPSPVALDGLTGAITTVTAAPGQALVVGDGSHLWRQDRRAWRAAGSASAFAYLP